jgi:hypothetical protein
LKIRALTGVWCQPRVNLSPQAKNLARSVVQ